MSRVCSHCRETFTIAEDENAFRSAIAPIIEGVKYDLPAPTLCPKDRESRRLSFRNLRNLVWRTCDLSQKRILSVYPPDSGRTVYHSDAWFSDQWDALSYGRAFDPSRPFFEQFRELYLQVPVIHHYVIYSENCEYINGAANSKDCYLSFVMDYCEQCLYLTHGKHALSCMDSFRLNSCELCYECIDCERCYALKFSSRCTGCSDSFFLSDCRQCKNCIACGNLVNREYCVFNQQVSAAEFAALKSQLTDREFLRKFSQRADDFIAGLPKRYYFGHSNESVSGNNLQHVKNGQMCFDCLNVEDSKYCNYVFNAHHCYDMSIFGERCEWLYECHSTGPNCAHNLFCMFCWSGSSNNMYCHLMSGCSNCFGCSGLQQKEYCILNRQYTKAEYEKQVALIIQHMQRTGEWGEFFPASMSSFAYNESHAFEYHPLSKPEALKRGYRWKEKPPLVRPNQASTVPSELSAVSDNILQERLGCESCGREYRLIALELKLYRDLGIPVPVQCPDCRYQARKARALPYELWERSCTACGTALQSSFSPEREARVVCERCYQETVLA